MKEIDPHLPINKLARQAVSKAPKDDALQFKISRISSSIPLPYVEVREDDPVYTRRYGVKGTNPLKLESTIINAIVTNTKIGKLQVLGLSTTFLTKTSKNAYRKRGRKWVVRCVCGKYEIRTTVGLNNPKTKHYQDCCVDCQKVNQLRQQNTLKDRKPKNLQS